MKSTNQTYYWTATIPRGQSLQLFVPVSGAWASSQVLWYFWSAPWTFSFPLNECRCPSSRHMSFGIQRVFTLHESLLMKTTIFCILHVELWDLSGRGDMYTTDSRIVCFHKSTPLKHFWFIFYLCSKMEGDNVFRTVERFLLCLLGLLSLFYQLKGKL